MTLNLQWAGVGQDGGLYNGTPVCDHYFWLLWQGKKKRIV